MSMRWDALLVRHTARELDERLARARLSAIRLDGVQRDVVLFFRESTLLWRLHPTRGYLRTFAASEPGPGAIKMPMMVRRVYAPPDERLLVFELMPVRGRRRSRDLMIELLGNQWNCIVTEGEERVIRHVLHTRVGKRTLRVGQPYDFPAPSARGGTDAPIAVAEWQDLTSGLDEKERRKHLIANVAWTSPLNAGALLGESLEGGGQSGDEDDGQDGGQSSGQALWQRWASGKAEAEPVLLKSSRGLQPYPFVLPNEDIEQMEPVDSLIEALERVADHHGADGSRTALLDPMLLRRLERAIEQAERRVTRLIAELSGLPDEDALRAIADLILARFSEIPSGVANVRLEDFEGKSVDVELDPALAPHANASTYYDRAGKTTRARDQLPPLIAQAESALETLGTLVERAASGTVFAEEIEAAIPDDVVAVGKGRPERLPPYRRYRSSGGIEIRVGRGARHNDDLTFHHSAPTDVWLHARHTAGAHVILRWNGPGNPPARDLAEAANLAALHSKARTSGSAPVDWTFRKYVRKPRGAAPGSVVPDRVQTVFVDPDERALETLVD
jgi:predicted ribosome quality control (RQC) complex YloA/Tae2 family protein